MRRLVYCELYQSRWHGCAACWAVRFMAAAGLAVALSGRFAG